MLTYAETIVLLGNKSYKRRLHVIARHTTAGITVPQLAAMTTKMVCQSSRQHLLQLPEKKGTGDMEVSISPERSPVKEQSDSRSLSLGEKTGEENRPCHCNGEISTVMLKSK